MGQHAWMVGHLISLIDYCEKNELPEVEAALCDAMERIGPALTAQPLVRKPKGDNVVAFPDRKVAHLSEALAGAKPRRRGTD